MLSNFVDNRLPSVPISFIFGSCGLQISVFETSTQIIPGTIAISVHFCSLETVNTVPPEPHYKRRSKNPEQLAKARYDQNCKLGVSDLDISPGLATHPELLPQSSDRREWSYILYSFNLNIERIWITLVTC
jgi:hypothetical protein